MYTVRFKPTLLFLILPLLLTGCGSKSDSQGQELARGISVSSVALYQGVKISLMENGQEVDHRLTPIVQGKDGMLRIYVSTQEDWVIRNVRAVVEFEASAETPPLEATALIAGNSVEDSLESTLNVDIPGDYFTGDLRYKVSLYEAEEESTEEEMAEEEDTTPEITGNTDGAVWPKGGDEFGAALGEEVIGKVELVLIPVRYNADQSGRLPDISQEQIEKFEHYFETQYPISNIEITVGEPMDWNSKVGAMGAGWAMLLNTMSDERSARGITSKQYIYGLFSPAETFMQFCQMGCVLGMSQVAATPEMTMARVSVGIGFTGDISASTMIHEVGHAHGREHSPCELQGQPSDPDWPKDEAHAAANIGIWGYDSATTQLKNPNDNKDFMSYCEPAWVSDYTYNGLAERVMAVNALAKISYSDTQAATWFTLVIGVENNLEFGVQLELNTRPMGREIELELLNANGKTIKTITGYFYKFSHLGTGQILFKEPVDAKAAGVRFGEYDPVYF